jgi:hypothetical protein
LRNLQQQVGKQVEVYYKCLFKQAYHLKVEANDVFFTIIFGTNLQPYLRLATTSMIKDSFIKHKEVVVDALPSSWIDSNVSLK